MSSSQWRARVDVYCRIGRPRHWREPLQLFKRDASSGLILAFVDTDAMTDDERSAVSDELHELIIECKCREASLVTDRGLEAQLDYLVAERGEGALTDAVLDTLDDLDQWRSWK